MTAGSVQPLIEAARVLELSIQRTPNDELANFVAALTSLPAMRHKLPPGFRVAPRKLSGPRVNVSRSRYANSVTTAFWPQDGLEVRRYPMLCGVLQGEATLPMEEYSLHAPAESLVFIPATVAHPDGSEAHVSRQEETDFCDLFWLHRWEGGLACHLCHSRGNMHTNFSASENCFIIGPRSIYYFDLLTEAVRAHQQRNSPGDAPSNSPAIDAAALPYLLPALLAVVGADLQAGHFVQPGTPTASATPVVGPGTDESAEVIKPKAGETASWEQPATWKEDYGAIMQVQSYAAFHLDRPLTIDQMAQMAFMSRAQFTRRFRLETGSSFLEYLTTIRLERAKLFLRDTEWSVDIIARAVGLRPSHLWNLFSRRLNTTPGEYRREARQKGGRAEPPKTGPTPRPEPKPGSARRSK